MPVNRSLRLLAAALVALGALVVAACEEGAHVIERLPIAALACPVEVEAGAEFVVDGSDSTGAFVEQTISVGADSTSTLEGSFTAGAPGVMTARLVITDAEGHIAEARCRIVVVEGAPVEPGPDAGPGEEPVPDVDITGRFALVAWDRPVLEDSSLVPTQQCVDAPVLALVDLTQSGDDVSMTWTYCAIVWPAVDAWFGVQAATWSAAAVDAMPPVHAEFTRTGDEFAPSLEDMGVGTVVGARVDDGAPLPTSSSDPTVSDDDGDGWPAVTLRSSTYAQDIVYRRFLRELSGTIVDADLITGTYRADAEASLVSWQDFMVPAGPGRASTFRLTRTDPATTCADVRASADALLAAFPAPAIDDCPAP